MTRGEVAKHDPRYGKGVVSLNLDEFELIDSEQVKQRLYQVFRDPHYQPPHLPASATQLLELTKRSDVQVEEVTRLLEQDQLLAAEVLKIAQSSAYAGSGEPVRTLGEALVRLGLKRTADVFFQASMQMRVFRVKGYQRFMDDLRRHSVAVAHIARLISRQTSLYDEHAFLCGLLHDAGIAAALIAFAESTKRGSTPPQFAQIWEPIRMVHAEAGGILARLWRLPDELTFVIEHHHDFMVGGYPHPTSAVIELSNAVAEEVGAGFGQESQPDSLDKALTGLGLSRGDFTKFVKKAESLVQSI